MIRRSFILGVASLFITCASASAKPRTYQEMALRVIDMAVAGKKSSCHINGEGTYIFENQTETITIRRKLNNGGSLAVVIRKVDGREQGNPNGGSLPYTALVHGAHECLFGRDD
jgi:hypothetical protein